MVRWRRHDDGAPATFGTEDALDEFLHFATALADQTDDDDIRARISGHHAEQHALADAAAGEQADTLTATHGKQRVYGAHADVERLADGLTRERIDRHAGQPHAIRTIQWTKAIERLTSAV